VTLRTANEAALRRLEQLQAPQPGQPHTFVFNGTEYPCSETREKVGTTANFGGSDEVIQKTLIVRAEVFGDTPPPTAGKRVTLPDIDDGQELRVLSVAVSCDGSHLTLELGEPQNQ
jgi:hypothetical protein